MSEWLAGDPVLIPYPLRMEQGGGIYSLSHNGTICNFRIHNDDFKLLKRVAQQCGVPHTALARWLVVHGIQALYKKHTGRTVEVVP